MEKKLMSGYARYTIFFLALMSFTVQARAAEENLSDATVKSMKWPDYEGAKTPTITILKNTSQVLRFDRLIIRVAVSNAAICDVTMVGEKDVLVYAKLAGNANLLVWDGKDSISTYSLRSTLDLDKLQDVLQNIDSDAHLRIVPFNDTAAVYGTAETSLKLKQINEAAKAFDKNTISYVKLRESKQVLLEVRFAEVNRTASKDQKLDLEAIPGFFSVRSLTGQTGASNSSNRSFTAFQNKNIYNALDLGTQAMGNLNGTYISSAASIAYFLKWLEQKNILKFIARPNLVAKDGEEASFVVGGEFPVPSVSNNTVQINYKEFGTKLKFTPEILDDEMIRLKTESEISELDFSTTVTSGGTTVPSVLKRTSQTIAEMHDNESLVIGGLITQKINRVNRKTPFLGDLPLLSVLFKGNEYTRTDVELLVVITPHIIKPFQTNEKKEFYNVNQVKEAVRVFSPDYADAQGDAINQLMTQKEGYIDFSTENVDKFVKSVADRMDRKKRFNLSHQSQLNTPADSLK